MRKILKVVLVLLIIGVLSISYLVVSYSKTQTHILKINKEQIVKRVVYIPPSYGTFRATFKIQGEVLCESHLLLGSSEIGRPNRDITLKQGTIDSSFVMDWYYSKLHLEYKADSCYDNIIKIKIQFEALRQNSWPWNGKR